jgi:hypothetical protein
MSEKKEVYTVGEHYRIETTLYAVEGAQLTSLTDSELVFKPCVLRKNAARLGQILYHDQTVGNFPDELIIARAQIVRAELWNIGG